MIHIVLVWLGLSMEFSQLVSENRGRLKRLADLRLVGALRGRVDSSDIIQEACIDAMKHFVSYQQEPKVSPYVWLRYFVCQRIIRLHRTHVLARSRDARRDVSIERSVGPAVESSVMAIQLFDQGDSPSRILQKREQTDRLTDVLDKMDNLDREVIALRNFEQISTTETAALLEISVEATYKRHSRALLRLKKVMADSGDA